jgi:methylated-DNA-[protein]-cysteine S-methyltransferase
MGVIHYTTHRTPWVPLLVASGAQGLIAVRFVPQGEAGPALAWLRKRHPGEEFIQSPEFNRGAVEELEAYSRGSLQTFTVPLDLRGSPFQVKVWQALRAIPFGETRSYADIARVSGSPKAFRAVGMANRSNPVCIVVPCHRVISSNGGLCGFGGGLKLKQQLLDHEQRQRAIATG